MAIELRIERLILDGPAMTPRERALLGASVAEELTRLLAEGGLSPELLGGVALPSVSAGAVQMPGQGGDPRRLGAEIARAVYEGIGGGGEQKR